MTCASVGLSGQRLPRCRRMCMVRKLMQRMKPESSELEYGDAKPLLLLVVVVVLLLLHINDMV